MYLEKKSTKSTIFLIIKEKKENKILTGFALEPALSLTNNRPHTHEEFELRLKIKVFIDRFSKIFNYFGLVFFIFSFLIITTPITY